MTPDEAIAKARDIVDEACLGEAFAANGVIATLTEAIAAALLSAAGGWNADMDAAPRDGTRILGLVYGDPLRVLILHWRDRIWWDHLDQVYFAAKHVTHWRHLPAPPETDK